MRIEKLTLSNFRGIREMTLEFTPNVNVLVGENGAGKSSILDAAAILLSRLVGRITTLKKTGRLFIENDISTGEKETNNEISIQFENRKATWNVSKTRKTKGKQTITNLEEVRKIVDHVYNSLEEQKDYSLPLCVYYSVNRAVLDVPLRIRTRHEFLQITTYDQALTGRRNDFRLFFEWFREREDYENEMIREDSSYTDRQLNAVRKSITAFTGFSNIRVRRNPLKMEVTKGNQVFNILQLSDGEKCLLALIGDLSRRLAIANPTLSDPRKGKGIVLIDEIDLHLHPSWQRKVISNLTNTFPNCQFILSTHSPQVISDVKPEYLFLLKQTDNGIIYEKPNESYGKNTDRILEDLMDVDARPTHIKERIQKLYRIIDKGNLKSARREIKSLKDEIGEDAELVRADVLIKRKEIIGK